MTLTTKRIVNSVIVLLILGGVAFAILQPALSRNRDRIYTTSCANHFTQIKMALEHIAAEHPEFILPSDDDAVKSLKFLERHIQSFKGQECPESKIRDGSLGYVFIGHGLKLGDVVSKGWLILFCCAQNHRKSSEHAHAYAPSFNSCVKTNAEMIQRLEHALAEGKSGRIPYSPSAMRILEREIAARKAPPVEP